MAGIEAHVRHDGAPARSDSSLLAGSGFAGSVFLSRPDDVITVLAAGAPLDDLDVLGDLDPPSRPTRPATADEPAQRFAAAALRPAAVDAALDPIDRALRWQLRALVRTEFDPDVVLPKVCARATLPLCLDRAASGLVNATVAAGRTTVEHLDGGWNLPRWLPDRRLRRAHDARGRLRQELAHAADQWRTARPTGSPHTVLDHLNDEPALAHGGLPGHTIGSLAALATVIPAAGLSWLIHELGRRPEDARRIRAEALRRPTTLNGTVLAERLPYAYAFAREVLRLHPPIWRQRRDPAEPVHLAARTLPAGQRVAFSPYLLHRDPRDWDEPDLFAPERWSGRCSRAPIYLPVGASRFGGRLATTLLALAAAQLCAEYELEVRHPDAVGARFGALLRPARLRVRLDRRC